MLNALKPASHKPRRKFCMAGILPFLTGLTIAASSMAYAADRPGAGWSSFRNGGASMATGEYPTKWSASEGLAWQKETEGYGQSSPLLVGGHIYVTSVIGPVKDECCLACFDASTGETLWSVRQKASTTAASNYSAARAAPTPVADDKAVYAFFEGGDVLCVSHDGRQSWHRSLTNDYGKFDNNHGLGSSPAQTSSQVILNIEHRGPSYLIALDKITGETMWKTDRPSGSSWTSPIVVDSKSGSQIIVSSGGAVTAFDPVNGQQLWTIGGLAGNSVPSPTIIGSRLFVGARVPEFGSTQEAAQSNLCIELGESPATEQKILWRASKAFCDYASPVVNGDSVYYLNNVGVLYCLNVDTGEVGFAERLGTTCWATPVVCGELTYFFGKDGTTQVIRRGSALERVATNQLWDPADPPKPESYQEHEGGHGHGAEDATAGESAGSALKSAEGVAGSSPRGRRGGMMAALLKSDANNDGKISEAELPTEFGEMMARVDLNSDKLIDSDELRAMEESFRKRREGSRESARDPIVYGVAAANGMFVVRTGTRLYCIRGPQ